MIKDWIEVYQVIHTESLDLIHNLIFSLKNFENFGNLKERTEEMKKDNVIMW